ncbi:MAG: DUF4919 domain-containing protein [Lentimicrobium sp.]|nr:DUF4919 domain-containing protein [Lentimicrobium sp.]
MTRQLWILLFTIFPILTYSQNDLDINYDEIKQIVNNPESEYYYPKLLERYNNFDTTLTHHEFSLIYYGFSFQDEYLVNQPSETDLLKLWKNDEEEKLIEQCEKILERNPVSLRAISYLSRAKHSIGLPEKEWRPYLDRYWAFRKVIVYSGDGLSCETAFKVIYVEDEYTMMYDYFEIKKLYEQRLVNLCDRHIVEPGEYFTGDEIYFDISRKLLRTMELHGE